MSVAEATPLGVIDRAILGRPTESTRSRGITGLPDRIVLIVSVVFIVAAACAAARVMFWWLFVPLALIAVLVTWRFVPTAVPDGKAERRGAIAALGMVVVWFAVSAPFASQYFDAIRDPGIYLLGGAAIAHGGGEPQSIAVANSLASSIHGLSAALGAFGAGGGNNLGLQGNSGVPAMIAIGYWVGGVSGAILVNLVLGAICLLAIYGLARRLVGPYWALVALALVGAAMPFVYLSRTTYTEIMATLLITASATWLIGAFATRRVFDFTAAGVLVGAASLTRVDGALAFTGELAGLVLVLLGVGRVAADERFRWPLVGFVAGGWVMIALGVLDLRHNALGYLTVLRTQSLELWGATAVLSLVLLVLGFTKLGGRGFEFGTAAVRIGRIAAIAVAVLFVFWLSRPFWLVDHFTKMKAYVHAIASLQAQDSLPIDGTRSYDEYSLWWFGWYFGWVFLALAIVGMVVWLYWAITRRNAASIVILATAAVVGLLYLDVVSVTPDQIWAFRRVLPVLTPTLALAAVLPLRMLWVHRSRWSRALAIVAVIGCFAGNVVAWGGMFPQVEGAGQAQEIAAICKASEGAKVIALAAPSAPPNYALTLRAVCNEQVVEVEHPSKFDWTKLAAMAGGKVSVVSYRSSGIPWTTTPTAATDTAVVRMWTRHLLQIPHTVSTDTRHVWVGTLTAGGTVDFVAG